MTASVVGAIAPKLEQAEIERAKRKPTESLDAYDYYLRGMASFHQWTREANNEALRLFYKAIELDPDFASAYGMAAWCYAWRKWNGWMTDRVQEIAEAARLARRAVELGKDDAVALSTAGLRSPMSSATSTTAPPSSIGRSCSIRTWRRRGIFSGWVRVFLGEPEVAIEHLARAMRLSPLDPLIFVAQDGIAFAHFFAGRYDEASSWAEKAVRESPNYLTAMRMARGKHCARRTAGGSAESHGALAPARSHAARFQSQGCDPASPTGRSRQIRRGPAKSGAAGVTVPVSATVDQSCAPLSRIV